MYEAGRDTRATNPDEFLEPTRYVRLPILRVPDFHVPFPGQKYPLRFRLDSQRASAQTVGYAFEKAIYLGLIPASSPAPQPTPSGQPAAEIEVYSNDGTYCVATAVTEHRLQVLGVAESVIPESPSIEIAEAVILPDHTLRPLALATVPNSWTRFSADTRRHLGEKWSGYPRWLTNGFSTEANIGRLKRLLDIWFSRDSSALHDFEVQAEDPVQFSYTAVSCLPMIPDVRRRLLETDSVDDRIATMSMSYNQEMVLKCGYPGCDMTLANFDDIFCPKTKAGPYVNTHGYMHQLITARRLQNYIPITEPNAEFSWFSGYAWQILECEDCGRHIGWRFSASAPDAEGMPAFYGLSRAQVRLVAVQSADTDRTRE
ncbi:unnamed protein product, partial [Mesorhabditis spiculigera]